MVHLQDNLYWTQHEIAFGVWDREKCTGLLTLIPMGCHVSEQRDDPEAPRYAAYGIYLQAKIERMGIGCIGSDFIHPNQFRDLLELLKSPLRPDPRKVVLMGDEGGVEIHFERREDGYVSVVGQIPAKGGYSDSSFTTDPLLLRVHMKTAVRFEFMVDPRRVRDSCDELEKLLEHVRSVETVESR